MSMTYYDDAAGKTLLKRRYKWAMLAFAAGVVTGALLVMIF